MVFKVQVSTVYECSLERAFKAPMLTDLSKVHTGFLIMPRVTHTSHDENWGKPGFSKRVYTAPSLTQKGGYTSDDKVLVRIENKYWKIEVSNFQAWMLGFCKFTGEWQTTELSPNRILIDYTYHLQSDTPVFYPINWIFAHTFWKIYMKQVLENVRQLAYSNDAFLYD